MNRMFTRMLCGAILVAALLVDLLPLQQARAAEPAVLAESKPSSKSFKVAERLQPFVDAGTLAGAVTLVATKDKTLSLEAVGYADIAAGRPMPTDAVFWIASMSKAYTAAAVMMLVDEGKVSLDDPVEKFLPEFKGQMYVAERDAEHVLLKKPKHPITVRNVLCHTAGLPHFSPIETPTLDRFPLADRVRSYAVEHLLFEPDTRYQYSNEGINTAGRIVEVVSGMSFKDFLDERLIEPAGMHDTTFWPNDEQMKRLATSYRTDDAGTKLEPLEITYLSYPLTDRHRGAMPGGGLFATAADVAKFCRILLNGGTLDGRRYLSEASVKEMSTAQTGDLPTSYGLGLAVDKAPGTGFGHGGAYGTNMRIDPKRGIVTVYMVQYAGKPTDTWKKVQPAFNAAVDEAIDR